MQTAEQALEGKWIEEDCGYETPCWIWQRACTTGGYAETFVEGRVCYAHRINYEMHVGPIPAGLFLDHLCEVRNCINPDHLEPVTDMENQRRGGTVKLTEEMVAEIKGLALDGFRNRDLAAVYGVVPSNISLIVNGHRWPQVAPALTGFY